jgi:hypothetical protein
LTNSLEKLLRQGFIQQSIYGFSLKKGILSKINECGKQLKNVLLVVASSTWATGLWHGIQVFFWDFWQGDELGYCLLE